MGKCSDCPLTNQRRQWLMIRFTRRTRFSFVAIISVLALAVGILGFAKAARSETTYDVLHAFRNIAGLNPVIRTTNGYFYGTTQRGGQYDGGTVFNPSSLPIQSARSQLSS